MKHPFRFSILPYFTLGAAGLGVALRQWLFSAVDQKGLLPAAHPADSLLFILSALALGILFLATRKPRSLSGRKAARLAGVGCYVAAAPALLVTGFSAMAASDTKLTQLSCIGYLLAGVIAVYMAFTAYRKKPQPFAPLMVFTAILMIASVALCRKWGSEPQLQVYFFPLLASIFSILSTYQATAQAAGCAKARLFAFYNQSALFFCILSARAEYRTLYLGRAFWAAAQFYCYHYKKEA